MVISIVDSLITASEQIKIKSTFRYKIKTPQQLPKVLWKMVDLLNRTYYSSLDSPFDLYNWLNHRPDEVAYFLNETSANAFNHSGNSSPSALQLWIGENGFILSVEQQGKGFNAQEVNDKKLKRNSGGGFTFFRNCNSTVFFDHPEDAKTIYMQYLFQAKE